MVRCATIVFGSLCILSAAQAQPVLPDAENGRYGFREMNGELLRLDSRTGQLSTCSKRAVGWACQIAPDERTVLENEISRLQTDNAELKKNAVAGLSPPTATRPERSPQAKQEEPGLKLPSDAELDRVMSFFEKVWRRLIDMVNNVQREMEKKS